MGWKIPKSAGGWRAIFYSLRLASKVGWLRLWRAMTSKNACKTCALGMGGQKGGMRNETGHWPEVCKKSLQAMVADMQHGLAPEFFNKYSIEQLKTLSPRELEMSGRLIAPLYAGPGSSHYQVVDWEFALEKIASSLRETPVDRHFFYASGRSANEAGFLLQLFARLHGTNFVNNCSYYCHQASGVGLSQSLGTSTATISLEDLDQTDLFFLIGGNPASNHPRLMRTLMQIRRRGGKVIVINPVREIGLVNFKVPSDPWSLLFGSKIASLYLQPNIGGDMALLSGIAKATLESASQNQEFIDQATQGFSDFKEMVHNLSWETIESLSGVSKVEILQAAELFSKSKNAVFAWTMGITHHLHGTENVRSIVNLALLRGMVGKPGAGLLPIRGHSNVQGLGSMGVVPNLREGFLKNLESYLGLSLPRTTGLDTMGCMEAAHNGEMDVAFCLGGNLFGSNPDASFAQQALEKTPLVVYLNTTLNTGHAWGLGKETLILPVLARDEEAQPTTQESMFNFVRLSEGGPARYPGARSEVEIIAGLGSRVLGNSGPVDWRKLRAHQTIREMIADIVPGYQEIRTLEKTRNEFHVAKRVFHDTHFPGESGQASFSCVSPPVDNLGQGELRLMTVRSEGQFNTVVYEEEDIYRGQERRDVILLNPQDMAQLGFKRDELVCVVSSAGVLQPIRVRSHPIRQGNALMYYPEANILVPKEIDPVSRTPAFKNIRITLERFEESPGKTPLPLA
ncbi:MAG: FdhF/YdeP family oxidoreductase [Gemmataceae bacterium]|nr:FdhF/YdeP family oxidoreductase [Gemmataceae bacterium]